MPGSSDTLWLLLYGFVSIICNVVLESIVLGLPDLAWSRFLQPEQNFLNHQVTVLWSTAPSPFVQQMLFVASKVWCITSSNWAISSWIRLHCMFICTAFKSHMEWNNAWLVIIPTITILSTTVGTYHNLNCFSHMLSAPQTSIYQNNFCLAPVQ